MLQEKLPKSSSNSKPVQNDETTRLLGINLGRSDSIRNGKRNFIKKWIFLAYLRKKWALIIFCRGVYITPTFSKIGFVLGLFKFAKKYHIWWNWKFLYMVNRVNIYPNTAINHVPKRHRTIPDIPHRPIRIRVMKTRIHWIYFFRHSLWNI